MRLKLTRQQMAWPHAERVLRTCCATHGVAYRREDYAPHARDVAGAREEDLEILVLLHGVFSL